MRKLNTQADNNVGNLKKHVTTLSNNKTLQEQNIHNEEKCQLSSSLITVVSLDNYVHSSSSFSHFIPFCQTTFSVLCKSFLLLVFGVKSAFFFLRLTFGSLTFMIIRLSVDLNN